MRRMWLLGVIMVTSCAPLPPVPFLEEIDVSPPVVSGMYLVDAGTLVIEFDEPTRLIGELLVSDGIAASGTAVNDGRALEIVFASPPSPTVEHWVEAQVADRIGNHLRFLAHFYGLNEFLPAMIINEFTTQGSGTHPDFVELRVLTDGNLAGACLYEGTPEEWEQRCILPPIDVSAGDYVVVHFKPEGIPEEVDESYDRATSGGRDASDDSWDIWVRDGTGLSGNNGVLTLCENSLGGYVDAVLYSNRTSTSDENYRGFGSAAVMERADAIAAAGEWVFSGPMIAPEDAIDPDPSTATRSISRDSTGGDSNASTDWHITPTRGVTPGAVNSDDVYVP